MEVRTALKGQYKAALAMLRDCIAKCPDDVWSAGMPALAPSLTLPPPSAGRGEEGANPHPLAPPPPPSAQGSGRRQQERQTRTFWRIAYHALFYAHLYGVQREEDFVPWARHVEHAAAIYLHPDEEVPPVETTYTQSDLLEYLDWIVGQVDGWVDGMDLDTQESGFYWYKDFPKLDHYILSIRHVGTHVGQLSERLFLAGIDTDWVSRGKG